MTDKEQNPSVKSDITLDDACLVLSQRIIMAAKIIEDLEGLGLVHGNGHHARQKIAQFAIDDLKSRWKGEIKPC